MISFQRFKAIFGSGGALPSFPTLSSAEVCTSLLRVAPRGRALRKRRMSARCINGRSAPSTRPLHRRSVQHCVGRSEAVRPPLKICERLGNRAPSLQCRWRSLCVQSAHNRLGSDGVSGLRPLATYSGASLVQSGVCQKVGGVRTQRTTASSSGIAEPMRGLAIERERISDVEQARDAF